MYSTKSITWSKEEKEKENGAKRRRRKLRERKLQISWQWTNDVIFWKWRKKKLCETQAPSTVNTKVSWRDFFFFSFQKTRKGIFWNYFSFFRKLLNRRSFSESKQRMGVQKGTVFEREGGGGGRGARPPSAPTGLCRCCLGWWDLFFIFIFYLLFFYLSKNIYKIIEYFLVMFKSKLK